VYTDYEEQLLEKTYGLTPGEDEETAEAGEDILSDFSELDLQAHREIKVAANAEVERYLAEHRRQDARGQEREPEATS